MCMVLQVRVLENHQNGKDTHVRGMQVFSVDERPGRRRLAAGREEDVGVNGWLTVGLEEDDDEDRVGRREELIVEPDWMGDLELR